MSRQALVNDGHCPIDAPDHVIAGLVYEQVFLARMTLAVQERGNFWGGRDAVPAASCRWPRAAKLLTSERAKALASDGLVIIDDALTRAEVAAARTEVEALDAGGQLSEVECQSKARIRNDRIGWLSAATMDRLPALSVVTKLLRALPAEVERHTKWTLSVPQTVMAAVYPGSREQPASYCKHFDGGGPGNPRQLTAIVYLNPNWDVGCDGGALRAYPPRSDSHVDVAPEAGRILLFNSVSVEHEVRPAYRSRYAVTLWASGDDGCKNDKS